MHDIRPQKRLKERCTDSHTRRHSRISGLLSVRKLVALLSVLLVVSMLPLFAGFEAHVINVTANIQNRTCRPAAFDVDALGNPIFKGQTIDNEYEAWGMFVSADSNHPQMPDLAVAFDSETPPATALDHGTPNGDFGGAGVGTGGKLGEPGENNRSQKNTLVIPMHFVDANQDGRVDDPVPEPLGGSFTFSFVAPTKVSSMEFIDLDESGGVAHFFDAAGILITSVPLQALGDNSRLYISPEISGVKKVQVFLEGTLSIASICFDPVKKPSLCEPEGKDFWNTHEGCRRGTGSSQWYTQVNTLSSTQFSGVFGSVGGAQICSLLWPPNCPHGSSVAVALCKAKAQTLIDELNVVSGKLDLDALIAGADDGDHAFDSLGLTPFSTIREALAAIEAVLANPASTHNEVSKASYVAKRITEFYEHENPIAPKCIFDRGDVPKCGCPDCKLDVNIDIHNDATVINNVSTDASTGGNSANGGDARSSASGGSATSTATGGAGGIISTGSASSTSVVTNVVNSTTVSIHGQSSSSSPMVLGASTSTLPFDVASSFADQTGATTTTSIELLSSTRDTDRRTSMVATTSSSVGTETTTVETATSTDAAETSGGQETSEPQAAGAGSEAATSTVLYTPEGDTSATSTSTEPVS